MSVATQPRHSLRFRGRSFLALVLAPEPPLAEWLAELDEWNRRSPGFFRGRPVVLDASAIDLGKEDLSALIADLAERDVRLMGVEGVKAAWLGLGMPPLVSGGRAADVNDVPEAAAPGKKNGAAAPPNAAAPPGPNSLVHDSPVRSGQAVIFPQGDVTVLGSVASGAEVIAGGSIHIYGTLRGRAIAGCAGDPQARVFCHRLEAELLAIDGLYRTAEEMEHEFRGRPVQAWLEGDAMKMAALS